MLQVLTHTFQLQFSVAKITYRYFVRMLLPYLLNILYSSSCKANKKTVEFFCWKPTPDCESAEVKTVFRIVLVVGTIWWDGLPAEFWGGHLTPHPRWWRWQQWRPLNSPPTESEWLGLWRQFWVRIPMVPKFLDTNSLGTKTKDWDEQAKMLVGLWRRLELIDFVGVSFTARGCRKIVSHLWNLLVPTSQRPREDPRRGIHLHDNLHLCRSIG